MISLLVYQYATLAVSFSMSSFQVSIVMKSPGTDLWQSKQASLQAIVQLLGVADLWLHQLRAPFKLTFNGVKPAIDVIRI